MEIGVDCGGTKCEGIVLDNNRIVERVIINKPSTKKVLLEVISKLFNPRIKFIGIGFPAPVNKGLVSEINNIRGWIGVDIEQLIERRFKVKCRVENDANCFALALSKRAPYQKYRTIVGITLGTGLGCGIVIDGRIHSGRLGVAGEIARVPYNDGMLEDFTGKKFFINQCNKEPKQVFKEARNGNKSSIKWVNEYAKHLGRALAIVMLAYDPDCIILGGNISREFDMFNRGMRREMHKYIYKSQSNVIIRNFVGKNMGCVGAAMLIK